MATPVEYLHLPAGADIPARSDATPYKAVVIIEQTVTPEWQDAVSDWLVDTGCFYMMAWGHACSTWNDSVDYSSMRKRNFEASSDDTLIMTTWHENESIDATFWYAEFCAHHPTWEFANLLLLDITSEDRAEYLIDRYNKAIQQTPP